MPTTVIHIKDAPKGWQSDPDYVYVGRPGKGMKGKWGNPWTLRAESDRARAVEDYEAHMRARLANEPGLAEDVRGLRGKTLVCFCKPKACHGDVLEKLAEEGA
jgi:hypothetical protein